MMDLQGFFMACDTRMIAKSATQLPMFIVNLAAACQQRVISAISGVMILDATDEIAGSVGTLGVTGDNDGIFAITGIKAGGLSAIPVLNRLPV